MSGYEYPYQPDGRVVRYVAASEPVMRLAMRYARRYSKDPMMPNASVIVIERAPVAAGANGSDYHRVHGCDRRKRGTATGEDYHLCEGCHPRNHSERRALRHAFVRRVETRGADLYLWGHYGCCVACWRAISAAGLRDVYLVEGAETLFNLKHPQNVIGRQFESLGS